MRTFAGLDSNGDPDTAGRVTIDKSIISRNGCGVYASYSDSFVVKNSTISSNADDGARAFLYSSLRITNCTVSENGGAGVSVNQSGAVIANSTISGNSGSEHVESGSPPLGRFGGGVYAGYGAGVSLTNSTISGNTADRGGGIYLYGNNGAATITHSTITRNTATEGGGMFIGNTFSSSFSFKRTLFTGNSASKGREVLLNNPDYGSPTVGSFNLFGFAGNSGIVGFTPAITDVVPAQPLDAILKPTLANNGGPTQTHALVAGSVAIDAVNDGTCPPPATDQRGIKRPRDGNGDGGPACDIGSFER